MLSLEEMANEYAQWQSQSGPGNMPQPGPAPAASAPSGSAGSGATGDFTIDSSKQVPLGAGTSKADPNKVYVDQNIPQFDPKITGADKQPLDLYSHLGVHEETERRCMDGGGTYSDCHSQATKAEKISVTNAGGNWGDYEHAMDGYLADSEHEHPAHASPDLDDRPYIQSGMPAPGMARRAKMGTPGGLQNMANEYQDWQREQARKDRTFGSLWDMGRAFHQYTINAINASARTLDAAGMGPSDAMYKIMKMGPSEYLANLGRSLISNDYGDFTKVGELYDALGIPHGFSNTTMSDVGQALPAALAGAGGIVAAAESMAARTGGKAIDYAIRDFGRAVVKHPWMTVIGDMVANGGQVVGGEKTRDIAAEHGAGPAAQAVAESLGSVVGGVGGGVFGNAMMTGTKWFSKLPTAVARGLLNASDNVAESLGLPRQATIANTEIGQAVGQKPRLPEIHPDQLEEARTAETNARNAQDATMDAWRQMQGTLEGTPGREAAQTKYAQAKETEARLVAIAEGHWDGIPKAVRGNYTYQQQAIRSQFADDVYPKTFAQDQIDGELKQVNQSIKDTYDAIAPADKDKGVAGYSADFVSGVKDANDMARGIQSRYWQRAPLMQQIPDREPALNRLDAYVKMLQDYGYDTAQMPVAIVKKLYTMLRPTDGIGNPVPLPRLNKLRNITTMIREAREKAYAAEDKTLALNLNRLESVTHDIASEAFPNNVPLQQAREFSSQYNQMFHDSELGPLLHADRQGRPVVHPEDAFVAQLMKRARGFRDTDQMIKWLQQQEQASRLRFGMISRPILATFNRLGVPGAVLGPTTSKMPVDPSQRAIFQQMRDDATNGIRSLFQEQLAKAGTKPEDIADTIDKWAPRMKAAGLASADVEQAGATLRELADRRDVLTKSAMAKYMQADPQKAIDIMWGSRDPASTAKELMYGRAGIGGFVKDPMALEGFRAAVIDKLYDASRGDPSKMTELLKGRYGRLMETVLSREHYQNLNETLHALARITGDEKMTKWQEIKTFGAQMLGLKVASIFHHLTHFVGEGGELKQAAMFSSVAGRLVKKALGGMPPNMVLRKAIMDPEYAAFIRKQVPTVPQEIEKGLVPHMRRMIRAEAGMQGIYNAWTKYATDTMAPGPSDGADPSSRPYASAGQHVGDFAPTPFLPNFDITDIVKSTRGMPVPAKMHKPSDNVEDMRSITDNEKGVLERDTMLGKYDTRFDPKLPLSRLAGQSGLGDIVVQQRKKGRSPFAKAGIQ